MSTTWIFSCENHPHLRWAKTKCGRVDFIGRGRLWFQGDVSTGKPGSPIVCETEASLAERPDDYQAHHRAKYAVECDCLYSDLRVHAEDYVPFEEQVKRHATRTPAEFSPAEKRLRGEARRTRLAARAARLATG